MGIAVGMSKDFRSKIVISFSVVADISSYFLMGRII
jgi:hypothetical protein